VLALATRRPLSQRQIGQLRHLASQQKSRILLLPLVAGPADVVLRPEALVRAVLAAARHLPHGTLVVPVPLPPRGNQDEELRARADECERLAESLAPFPDDLPETLREIAAQWRRLADDAEAHSKPCISPVTRAPHI